jgi:hypothetical protein
LDWKTPIDSALLAQEPGKNPTKNKGFDSSAPTERKNSWDRITPNIIEPLGGGATTEHQATDKALELTQNEETHIW